MKRRAGAAIVIILVILIFIAAPLAYVIAKHMSEPGRYPLWRPTSKPGDSVNYTWPQTPPGGSGATGSGTTGTGTGTNGTGTGGTTPSVTSGPNLCSNAQYSTYWTGSYVALDSASQQKLQADAEARGNAALDGISDLTCLESLILSYTDKITNLTAIQGLTNLKDLSMTDWGVYSLQPIAGMTKMESLGAGGTNIKDISVVRNMPNLNFVDFARTGVSDASPLYNLQYLEYIYLQDTEITEMPPLGNFPYLKQIYVSGTPYTDNNFEDCVAVSNSVAPYPDVVCI